MSSNQAEQYHSITFGDKNTWDDWHLVPMERPSITPPDKKSNTIDVPGSNGSLDYSESLTGYPLFQNRQGSIEFMVMNGYGSWIGRYTEILNYLHGQTMHMILDDDPGYYYEGCFEVNEWKSDKEYSLITIDYDVYPYKKEITSSLEDWLWDPFDFEHGYIREYKNLTVTAGTQYVLNIPGSTMPVVPKINATIPSGATLTVTYKDLSNTNKTVELNNGANTLRNMLIFKDRNQLKFNATGGNPTISVDYRGGLL